MVAAEMKGAGLGQGKAALGAGDGSGQSIPGEIAGAKVVSREMRILRKLTGKGARLRDKQFDSLVVNVKDEDTEVTEIDAEARRGGTATGGDRGHGPGLGRRG